MPELPEVETVVRDLRPLVVGRTIEAVRMGKHKLRRAWQSKWNGILIGNRIDAVRRRGKWIVLELNAGPRLLVHLGMTGQLTAVPAAEPLTDHLHMVFELDRHRELRFRDVRRFGCAAVLENESSLERFFQTAKLGPEPFNLDAGYFRTAVRNANRSLKAILLDQRILAGVGNIYADEACFRARLHPGRKGTNLTLAEADTLRDCVEAVLTHAIEQRGSTIRDYIGGSGLRGGFQDEFRVYGRTGLPCATCSTPIQRLVIAGRSSHFCPACQGKGSRIQNSRGRQEKGKPCSSRASPAG